MRFVLLLCSFSLVCTCLRAQEVEYVDLPGTDLRFAMVSLPGGEFKMGEEGVTVTLSPFAIGAHEVTHDLYRIFQRRDNDSEAASVDDYDADAITRPTPPYLDFTYGMGTRGGFPAVNMTQQAALRFCEWLYRKTGRFFRLPTEAEWEYACLAGGEGPTANGETAWTYENAEEKFHRTGMLQPNDWGLYDMLGNASEWTADKYVADYFSHLATDATDPWIAPDRKHSRTVRGGHFDTDAADAGCRVREKSQAKWQARDPQIPKSKWWNVDSPFLGFRLVSPAAQPTRAEAEAYFARAVID